MIKRQLWKVKDSLGKNKDIANQFNIHPILADIIESRGVREDQFSSFLYPRLEYLHLPSLLPDIEKAKKRIEKAISRKEDVMVFGDYDVDGVTSLAIFYEFAKKFPKVFSFYIPHRVKEGYGLNKAAIKKAKKGKVTLIVAFDCGTNSYDEVEYAKSLGIDLIVIDHHLPQSKLSKPLALVNPKREDSKYPFYSLSTGGLSFKLLQLLGAKEPSQVLDLVALSIVCDVVPLLGENRILLKEGIKILRKTSRPAVKALCQIAKIKQKNIDTFHIGYILGPRINASGRIAHAKDALSLFLSDDLGKAHKKAEKLDEYNKLRKNVEKQILKEAEFQISNNLCGENAIVIGDSGWHPGVLGIVASRIKDKYRRPSFVVSFDKGVAKGSGRSVESIHLMEMLHKCSSHLTYYGGHKKAVGMELEEEKLDIFRDSINLAIGQNLDPKDFLPALEIDKEIKFNQINTDFINQLNLLYPYGEANPKPLFLTKGLIKKKNIQKIKSWRSVWLTDSEKVFEVVVYNKDLAEIINYGEKFDIVYSLGKDNYHNHPRLVLRDCRLA